jgi:hypothetical protein
MLKISAACNSEEVSDPFVFFNDDHFLLQPINTDEIKYWYSISLGAKAQISEGYNRVKALNTMEVIQQNCPFFDIHVPMVIHKAAFVQIMSNPALLWEEKDYLVKTVYANYYTSKYEHMKDCKIREVMGYNSLMAKIAGRIFFSTGPIFADLKKALTGLYPGRSKYELTL